MSSNVLPIRAVVVALPGAEIATRVHKELFGQLKAPVVRVGAARSPVPFSKALEDEFIPTKRRITDAVLEVLK